jgi:hypothetical protein
MAARAIAEMEQAREHALPTVADRRTLVRYFDGRHCIAWHGNVQIVLSTAAPSMQEMGEIADQLEALGRECQGGTGCLLVIRSDVSPPEEDVRKFIRIKLERSSMLATAQIVLGTGFRGAAMRAMLSVLQMAIRPKYAMRIFGDLRAGGEWLTEALEERAARALPADSLVKTTQELVALVF